MKKHPALLPCEQTNHTLPRYTIGSNPSAFFCYTAKRETIIMHVTNTPSCEDSKKITVSSSDQKPTPTDARTDLLMSEVVVGSRVCAN